jgi:hypothetical protein
MKKWTWMYVLSGVLIVWGLHVLDDRAAPVISNWLDWLVVQTFAIFPFLQRLNLQDPTWIACVEVGFTLFILASIAGAMMTNNDASRKLAGKLFGIKGKDDDDQFAH